MFGELPLARGVLSLSCMPPNVLTEISYRILLAAVDLGWTPPAWRSDARPEPFTEAEPPLSRIGHAIETQRTLQAR